MQRLQNKEDAMLKDSSEYKTWQTDLSESSKVLQANKRFLQNDFLKCDEIFSAEDSNHPALKAFDIYSGVDLVIKKKGHLFGIASRMQTGRYNTFTIRKERHTGVKTELEKRKEAIKIGAIYPKWTMQGYYSKPYKINSIGICKTADLFQFLEDYPHLLETKASDNYFLTVKWSDMNLNGFKVKVFETSNNDLWMIT